MPDNTRSPIRLPPPYGHRTRSSSSERSRAMPTLRRLRSVPKHRKDDEIVPKRATADTLKEEWAKKPADAPALNVLPKGVRTEVFRLDLAAARSAWLGEAVDDEARKQMEETDFLMYKDREGRFADFHALRHTTGSFLAAGGVSPKVAQAVMRHSDINLTMSTYSHAYREDEAKAAESLPDLARRPQKRDRQKTA